MFGETPGGKYRTTVCAATGADDNILDSNLLSDLMSAGVEIVVQDPSSLRTCVLGARSADGAAS